MNKTLRLLILSALFATQSLSAGHGACLDQANQEMNDLYSVGDGCEDGIFTSVTASMIGWGVGLFAGIALITGLIHSHSPSSSSSSSSSSN